MHYFPTIGHTIIIFTNDLIPGRWSNVTAIFHGKCSVRLNHFTNIVIKYNEYLMGCIKSKNKQPFVVTTGLTRQPSASAQSPTGQTEVVKPTATVTKTTTMGTGIIGNRPPPLNLPSNKLGAEPFQPPSPQATSIKNFM